MSTSEEKNKKMLEPRIDPTTKKMDVGGILIPPTNLITALLFGFANHTNAKAKEYYPELS